MTPVKKKNKRPAAAKADHRPSVLVVDDEQSLIELVDDVVGRQVDCKIITATSVKQAKRIIATQHVELLVADINLPDGDGLSLIPSLREKQPHAGAIVITGAPSVDGAITAMRHGAIDFVPKPFSAEQITDRVRMALDRNAAMTKTEKRLDKMRDAVKRLGQARKMVGKKVDLLCNDLVGAYTELSKQFDTVRTQEGFRSILGSAKDMEQVLCHAMDWMLRELGYSNVAIWLAADEQEFQLGAYMKYTIPGEPPLITAIKNGLLPTTQREGMVRWTGDEAEQRLTPAEMEYLSDQAILGSNCTYLGEPLAAVILFRDASKPFTAEDEEALRAIGPIFACSLAAIVREGLSEPLAEGDGESGEAYEEEGGTVDDEQGSKSNKPDPSDWWKRGEAPPF